MKPENLKDRYSTKKVPVHLVPSVAIVHEAQALKQGAEKYGAFNWRETKVVGSVYIAAALRHIYAYLDGENVDGDSGAHPLGHARASLGILLDAVETESLEDDRPEPGAGPALLERLKEKEKPQMLRPGDISSAGGEYSSPFVTRSPQFAPLAPIPDQMLAGVRGVWEFHDDDGSYHFIKDPE